MPRAKINPQDDAPLEPELELHRALQAELQSELIDLAAQLQQARTRLSLFKSISTRINSGLAMQQIIERTLQEAHKSFPELRLSYCTLDGDNRMQIVSSCAPSHMPSLQGVQVEIPLAEGLARELHAGAMVITSDVRRDPRFAGVEPILSQYNERALAVAPVSHPKRHSGFLSFGFDRPRQWSAFETATLNDMAEYLAIALREANAHEERRKLEAHLRQSQKMDAIGRLVGGIAHDFNNLLTGMMIYCGLLANALGKDHALTRHVQEIKTSGERGASLVSQLLALTRQQMLESRNVSLNHVALSLHDMLQRLLGEQVQLAMALGPDLSATRGDASQLHQVLLNLAINARDAMPQGGVLRISTRNFDLDEATARRHDNILPGRFVVMTVADNGSGMSPETQAHLFEPFFTTKERGQGTGLGLATAYGIVQQHGGFIEVDSAPGKGSKFSLYFPAVAGLADPVEELREEELEPAAAAAHATLLLVEDEDIVRRSLKKTLQHHGYSVLEAANAQEALRLAEDFEGHIPLMITDLVMPGLTGRELAERLSEARPLTRVLYISGYTDDPRTRRLLAEGADFLRKPFSGASLLNRVRQLLDESTRLTSSEPSPCTRRRSMTLTDRTAAPGERP